MTVKFIDKDRGYKRIGVNIKGLKDKGVKVGIMGSDSYDGVSVVDYGTWNEFGTNRIPPRPFMAITAARNGEKAQQFTSFLVGRMIDGKISSDQVLKNLGEWYQAQMQLTIRNAKEWAEPNAPSTIAMKGSSSPLIDQGRLVQSIRYEIVDGLESKASASTSAKPSKRMESLARIASKLAGVT